MRESNLLFGPLDIMLRQEDGGGWIFGIVVRRRFGWFSLFGINYLLHRSQGEPKFCLYVSTNLLRIKQIVRGVRVEDFKGIRG